MKRLVTFLVFALTLAITSHATAEDNSDNSPTINVSVDPRIELMSIIFRLAGADEYNANVRFPYTRAVDVHFGEFKDHPVIVTARRLRREYGVSYDAVVSIAMHVDNAIDLKERIPFDQRPARLDGRWKTDEAREFLKQARQFVKDTGFSKFMADNEQLFDSTAQRLSDRLSKREYIPWFDRFFGARPGAKFKAIPGMLTGGNCYGAGIRFPNDTEEICMVLGVWSVDWSGIPKFTDDIVSTVVHEYCHSYTNAYVDNHRELLVASGKKIFPHVEEIMSQQAYESWQTVVYESCVRACVARYILAADGEKAAAEEIRAQHKRGFAWTGELFALLDKYEKNRSKYPDFNTFFPEIVQFFDDYAKRDLATILARSIGPINRVFSEYLAADRLIVVCPDNFKDEQLGKRVADFVSQTHNQFFASKGVKLVKASDVTQEDMKTKAMVVYGSPTSNRIIGQMAPRCGMEIEEDHLVFGGKRFDGEGLVLIAVHPNPLNEDIPILFYTSANDSRVINLNHFFHGPTDYVVGKWGPMGKATVISNGDLRKDSGGKWKVVE